MASENSEIEIHIFLHFLISQDQLVLGFFVLKGFDFSRRQGISVTITIDEIFPELSVVIYFGVFTTSFLVDLVPEYVKCIIGFRKSHFISATGG